MTTPSRVHFAGGDHGAWRVLRIDAVRGETLPAVSFIDLRESPSGEARGARWVLQSVTSNTRYVDRAEITALRAIQAPLGRPEATRGALIPITKSPAWWDLAQDERRLRPSGNTSNATSRSGSRADPDLVSEM